MDARVHSEQIFNVEKDLILFGMHEGRAQQAIQSLTDAARGVFRIDALKLLDKLEAASGSPLNSLAYKLRAYRLGSHGDDDQLDENLISSLLHNGFDKEADALQAVHQGGASLEDWIEERVSFAGSAVKEVGFKEVEFGELDVEPKLSLITSVYNGEREIPSFLEMLSYSFDGIEVPFEVLIFDSNSEDNSFDLLKSKIPLKLKEHLTHGKVRLISTEVRETIQATWNQGISMCRGEYIGFPGLDEAYIRHGLKRLIKALDTNPTANWVQGLTLIYKVDEEGNVQHQFMPYRHYELHGLNLFQETTQFFFIGALHRRSFFDEGSTFDDSFRGAGDTDYKLRNLGGMNCIFVPELTGCYRDFPVERVTASAHVEIEDMRAWYAYRTSTAIAKILEDEPIDDILQLLIRCARYRKSYTDYDSSDWVLAKELASVLKKRPEFKIELTNSEQKLVKHMSNLATAFVELPRLINANVPRSDGIVEELENVVEKLANGHKALRKIDVTPVLEWYKDNNQEQHFWLWPTPDANVGQTLSVSDVARNIGGIQDMSEALVACGSICDEIGLRLAWHRQKLHYVRRSQILQEFDISILVGRNLPFEMQNAISEIIDFINVHVRPRSILLVGDGSREVFDLANLRDKLFFTSLCKTYLPVLLCSRTVVHCLQAKQFDTSQLFDSVRPWVRESAEFASSEKIRTALDNPDVGETGPGQNILEFNKVLRRRFEHGQDISWPVDLKLSKKELELAHEILSAFVKTKNTKLQENYAELCTHQPTESELKDLLHKMKKN